MNLEPKHLRGMVEKRLTGLKQERQSWDDHWMEIAEHNAPRKGRFLGSKGGSSAGNTRTNRGEKVNGKIYDATAIIAGRTLQNGMSSGMTPSSRPWFRLTTKDPELRENAAVKAWLAMATTRLYELMRGANFYAVSRSNYGEMGHFGTAAGVMSESFVGGAYCDALTIGEYWLATGPNGRPDTLYRRCDMTVAQMVDRFVKPAGDWSVVSKTVKDLYDTAKYDQWVEAYQAIEPNRERDATRLDRRNMLYRSVYFEAGNDKEQLLAFEGFREQPFWGPRWDVTGANVYGNGPGMDARPHVKSLQLLALRKAQVVDKLANPAMIAPSSLQNDGANTQSNAINYVSGDEAAVMKAVYEPRPDAIQAIRGEIAAEQSEVDRHYYADLFMLIAGDTRSGVTAREIDERYAEKMLQLGPVVERSENELLEPAVERGFAILMRIDDQLRDSAPEELQGREIEIQFVSILAQAQRAVAAGAIERSLAFAGNLAAVKPDILDKIDFDQALDEYTDIQGLAPNIVIPDDVVARQREQRAQQQQMAQMAAAARPVQEAASAAKLLSETDAGPTSALAGVLGLRGQ